MLKLYNFIVSTIVVSTILLTLCFDATSSAKLPNYVKVCKASDPEIVDCIASSIKDILPKLQNGISELNIPPIEPLHLNTIKLQNGKHSVLSNLSIYGVSTFQLNDLQIDLDYNKFTFQSMTPSLTFDGTYDLDIQMVFIPIRGQGTIRGTFNNFYIDGLMQASKYFNNDTGKDHLDFETFQLSMDTENAQVELDNLFNGDSFLGYITNSIINSHIHLILDDVMPALENSLALHLTEIANRIMEKFPYDEVFPQ